MCVYILALLHLYCPCKFSHFRKLNLEKTCELCHCQMINLFLHKTIFTPDLRGKVNCELKKWKRILLFMFVAGGGGAIVYKFRGRS